MAGTSFSRILNFPETFCFAVPNVTILLDYYFLIIMYITASVALTICSRPGPPGVNLKILRPYPKSIGKEDTISSALVFGFFFNCLELKAVYL